MRERSLLEERYRWDKTKEELTDLQTGEIYNCREEAEKWLDIIDEEKHSNNIMINDVKDTFGIKSALQLYQFKWKDDSWFIKIYRTEMREYKKKTQLSSSAGLLLFYIQDYIEYKTNRIANQSGKSFTNKELGELAGLSEKTVMKALNELETKKFIKRFGKSRSREFYFNPYLASAGNEMDKSLLKMFDDYTPITPF